MKIFKALRFSKSLCLLVAFITTGLHQLHAQEAFAPLPVANRPHLQATRVTGPINIDGIPDEAAWNNAPAAAHFTTAYPRQGDKATYDTEVRLLYDDKNIYISARCDFPPGKKSLQVQDLRRDFSYSNNELFEILIDPFKDPRMPVMTFCVTPYGTQMDIMHYADFSYDYKWDAVWQAASKIQEHSWTTEVAIPFTSLRYPKNSTEWSINFARNIRFIGETNGWSPWPQAFSETQLAYGGILTNMVPPDANFNLRVEPYALVNARRADSDKPHYKPEFGGEIKYAINSNTLLEGTINTDFAQADVDKQVVNLSRSSVFFPEKRQFFLENSSLFSVGQNSIIQPFFSRRIGLSDNGSPLTINGGLRFIHQDNKQSAGILVMKQNGDTTEKGALFGVFRYKRSVSQRLQLGAMEVLRQNFAGLNQSASVNPVEVVDAFWQVSQPLFIRGMASYSGNSLSGQKGPAAFAEFNYSATHFFIDWFQTAVSKGYQAQTGFTARDNFINTQPTLYIFMHKKWFPKNVQFFSPQFTADIYHEASSGKFQEASVVVMPLQLFFTNQSHLDFSITSSWENLTDNFQPVRNVDIAAANYHFNRYEFYGITNAAAPFSAETRLSTGGYYNGRLNSYYLSLRAAPVPQLSLVMSYTRNDFKNVGINQISTTTHLLAPELRVAANPKILLSAFYQYNTDARNGSLNARFSWEYRPLSFIYLVINSVNNYYKTPFGIPQRQQGGIMKLTYIRQI
jgi:hypothetical protein